MIIENFGFSVKGFEDAALVHEKLWQAFFFFPFIISTWENSQQINW